MSFLELLISFFVCCLVTALMTSLVLYGYIKIKVLMPLSNRIKNIKKRMITNGNARMSRLLEKRKKEQEEELQNEIEAYQKEIDDLETQTLNQAKKFYDDSKAKIEEAYNILVEKNTLYFNCSCNERHKIPCLIDFTNDENKFVCPHCNSVWVVKISATPVLRGYNTGVPDSRHLRVLQEREPFSDREDLGGVIV